MPRARALPPGLGEALEGLRRRFGPGILDSDPLRYPRQFADRADREVVGFLAAGLAFGRVASIFRSLDDLLRRIGPEPARWMREESPARRRSALRGFRHRWVGEGAIADATRVLGGLLCEHGTIEAAFAAGPEGGRDLKSRIGRFAQAALLRARRPEDHGFRFLFPDPARGGACKRIHLFLRWMVRKDDGLDLGLWTTIGPEELLIPLDTHVAFLGRALGLTARRTPDWRMAEEITARLRTLDPGDPVKYDWALTRLGILRHCPERRDPAACPACPIVPWCRVGRPLRPKGAAT